MCVMEFEFAEAKADKTDSLRDFESESKASPNQKEPDWAIFLQTTVRYLKYSMEVRRQLNERNLNTKFVVEATDHMPGALLTFKDRDIIVTQLSMEDSADKTKWDGKISGKGEEIFHYFLGEFGRVRPLLTGKLKPTRLLNLLKMDFFVKLAVGFFNVNKSFAKGIYYKFYPK